MDGVAAVVVYLLGQLGVILGVLVVMEITLGYGWALYAATAGLWRGAHFEKSFGDAGYRMSDGIK